MSEIEISKIKIGENNKRDLGDLTELVESIKQHGIIEPVVLDSKNELMAGRRRVEAAKKAGLKFIPFVSVEVADEAAGVEITLIENIHRKDLNLAEESDSFKSYIQKTKHNDEYLAKKIGKSVSYVRKRIIVSNLPEEIKKEIRTEKLVLGHALVLARLENSEAKKYAKEIIANKQSVEKAVNMLSYKQLSISEAPFSKKDCKNCRFNGSKQSELFETGKALNGKCLNPSCYNKKLSEYLNDVKKHFKDNLFKGEEDWSRPRGFQNLEYSSMKEPEKQKLRTEKDPSKYLIKIKKDGKIEEFYKPKSEKTESPKDKEETKKARLDSSVTDFKRGLMLEVASKLLSPENKLDSVIFWDFCNRFTPGNINTKEIFSAKSLRSEISKLAAEIFNDMDNEDLETASKSLGFVPKTHFKMTEEFLDLFTKDQLKNLINELGIPTNKEDWKKLIKWDDYKDFVINNWKEGMVPKTLL